MRLYEISKPRFNPYLLEFWKQAGPNMLKYYFTQNHCAMASQDLKAFLESHNVNSSEFTKIGQFVNGKKKYGWFKADKPDLSYDALTNDDISNMRKQGLNPKKKQDRISFMQNNDLYEEFCMIPHSWLELKGEILDPSGFYIDGKSGQFDKLVTDKSNLASRYFYYP